MNAFTVKQPWAWAICHGGKDVENRSKPYPAKFHLQHVALHAGLDITTDGLHALELRGIMPIAVFPLGVIVATLVLEGYAEKLVPGGWYEGNGLFGWKLRDVRVLSEPVPARGFLGLWGLTAVQEAEVLRLGG